MSSALLVNIFIIYIFMKRILFFVFLTLYSVSLAAQTENASLARVGDKMVVKADVQLTPCMIKGVKAFVLEPQITDGENVVKLAPIGLYSKEKFYPYLNAYGFSGKEGEKVYSKEQLPVTVSLNESVPYQAWMDGARLELVHLYEGCCGDSGIEAVDTLSAYAEAPIAYTPVFHTIEPERLLKIERLSGSAAIDFPVNSIELKEDFHKNLAELNKIKESIEKVQKTEGVNIQRIIIRGKASPEGKYASNEKLAKGRGEAVRNYITGKIEIPENLVVSEYEAEDWDGLRKWVDESSLKNKAKILEIIDSDIDLDKKEASIRNRFPSDWAKIKKDCLPWLRRTEYDIAYQTFDFESIESQITFANEAMQEGVFEKAAGFLAKAGNGPEADYARGVFFALQKDYEKAEGYFLRAKRGNVSEADEALAEISRFRYLRSK